MGAGARLHPGGGRLVGLNRGQAGASDGVRLLVQDGAAYVDVAIIAQPGHPLRPLGQVIQQAVTEAFDRMLDMPVAEVNVFVEDIAE